MRLNIDCVRDILLCVEENTTIRKMCLFVDLGLPEIDSFLGNDIAPQQYQTALMEHYENDILIYHVQYCIDSELISISDISDAQHIYIRDLTPTGHNFLADIRENNNWNNVKNIASKVGSTSFSALSSIASELITSLIKQQFKLS